MCDLSVITVTFNSREHVEGLIHSLFTGIKRHSYEHIIVDNDSADGTAAFLEESYASFIRLIKSSRNGGFAHANNLALKEARGKHILFLNPDMKLSDEGLDEVVSWFDTSEDVGIIGCMLKDEEGGPLRISYPKPFPNLKRQILWLLRLGEGSSGNANFDVKKQQEVDSVKGAFMLVRRSLLEKLGWGFDPRYFLLFEDFDLCREAKKHGFRVIYTPKVFCTDYNSRSFAKMPSDWIYLQCVKSLLVYFRKWHSWYEWIWIALLIPVGYLMRIPAWGIKNILKKSFFH